MHPIQFGFCLPIFAMPGARLFRTPNYAALEPQTSLQMAYAAERLGYDSLWVVDHLMIGKDEAVLEGWTVLAALAGSTTRPRLGMIHQAHFFRHPALAAKMTATLDHISQGRFIYFIDGGYGEREHHCYGLPYPDTMEARIEQVVDGVELTLALWQADQPIDHQGKYYQVTAAVNTPLPLQKPHPPVWFGEAHPPILDACARYGQGWKSVPASLAELQVRLDRLDQACRAVGRTADELEKALAIQILIAPDIDTLRHTLQAMIDLAPDAAPLPEGLDTFLRGATDILPASVADTWLIGTPDQVAARLQEYVDLGFNHFLLWFMDAPSHTGLELFAQTIAPRFRTNITS